MFILEQFATVPPKPLEYPAVKLGEIIFADGS